ncbi:MAG: hypothetical protein JWN04_4977 [Myxococcaceae bacterium]|nr:hypothetical protein [Myxococcaceae bacterium]
MPLVEEVAEHELETEAAPLLRETAPAVARAILVMVEWLEKVLKDFFEVVLETVGKGLARALFESKPSRDAFMAFWLELGHAFGQHYMAVAIMSLVALMSILAFVLMPLGWRYCARRSTVVFVSFSSPREIDAVQVQASLEAQRVLTTRIPYQADAPHQQIVVAVTEALRKAHLMLCVPELQATFVDSEVMAAAALGRGVVFLLSEARGTLPNTADKRYPVFKLERARAAAFAPVVDFVRYIGGDFGTHLEIARRARRTATGFFGTWHGAYISLGAWLAAAAYSYAGVFKPGSAMVLRGRAYAGERFASVAAHAFVFWLGSTLVILSAAYVSVVLVSRWRQMSTQKKAALEAGTGAFSRDDWLGLVPGLEVGSAMYDCMFETAPAAHHEKAVSGAGMAAPPA